MAATTNLVAVQLRPCSRRPQAATVAAAASPAAATPAVPHTSTNTRWQAAGRQQLLRKDGKAGRCSATDFHQSQLVATERDPSVQLPPLPPIVVKEAESDGELQASAWLRAFSFYRYPPERKFAAEVHRLMVAEEEYKALKVARLNRKLDKGPSNERSACLVALCDAAALTASNQAVGGFEPLDARLLVDAPPAASSSSGSYRAGSTSGQEAEPVLEGPAVVGTLDVYAVRALEGEVLIGDSRNAAYLANVCTAAAARRRGVGLQLLQAARELAVSWGVDALYVHTMAVNEIAVRFYETNGFIVEKEETSNQAHYRGRCLDGIEGRGRTVLLRDTRLHEAATAPAAATAGAGASRW